MFRTFGNNLRKWGRFNELKLCITVYHFYRGIPVNAKARDVIDITGLFWLRGLDLNQRPSGYEPDELPGCSTPRQ
jgi:hypothetical protein